MSAGIKCVALTYNTRLQDVRGYMGDVNGSIWTADFQGLHESVRARLGSSTSSTTYPQLDSKMTPLLISAIKAQSGAREQIGHGEITLTGTGLYAVAWGSDGLSLFYQTVEDGKTCLREYHNNGTEWFQTHFIAVDVNPGTSIAVAIPGGEKRAQILYQNKDNNICAYTLEKARLRSGIQPVATTKILASARSLTGIGVCIEKDSAAVLAYYQDPDGSIREFDIDTNYCGHVSSAQSHHIDSIAAISDKNGTRIYARSSSGSVMEYQLSRPRQICAGISVEKTTQHLPNSSMVAVSDDHSSHTSLLWIGEDLSLHITSYQTRTLAGGESKGYGVDDGSFGSNHEIYQPAIQSNGLATSFGTLVSHPALTRSGTPSAVGKLHPGKVIRQIYLRIKCEVEDIKVVYDGENKPDPRVPLDGEEFVFELELHEYITHVWYTSDGRNVKGLMFGTSHCRMSAWLGARDGLHGLYKQDGRVLVDLALPAGSRRGPNLLDATWEVFVPTEYIAAQNARVNALSERFQILQRAVTTNSLRNIATENVAADFNQLVECVEVLHQQEKSIRDARVKATDLRPELADLSRGTCYDRVDNLLRSMEGISARLQPVLSESLKTIRDRRRESESLAGEFHRIQDSMMTYTQTLKGLVNTFKTNEDSWKRRVDLAKSDLTGHSDHLRQVAASKRFTYSEPPEHDYASPFWGIQAWGRNFDPRAAQDEVVPSIINDTAKACSRWQLNRSQLDFLQATESLLANPIARLDVSLATIASTLTSLREVRNAPGGLDDADLRGPTRLLNIAQELVHELRSLRGQPGLRSQEFASPLNGMLVRLQKVESFQWGTVDMQCLLTVTQDISTKSAD